MDANEGASNREDLSKPGRTSRRKSWRSWATPWLALAIVVLVVGASYAIYAYETSRSPGGSGPCSDPDRTLVVDTYDSFMASGAQPSQARSAVFQAFENLTHDCVVVNYLEEDPAEVLLTAHPGTLPGVILGLDEVTAAAVEQRGLLYPFRPSGFSEINTSLVQAISPESDEVIPYEYGFLGIDYFNRFNNETDHQVTTGDIFQNVQNNATLARNFLYENPTTSVTGKEFLLWQYELYNQILHENWTVFWNATRAWLPNPSPSWSSGFAEFNASGYQMFVSYTTDPAYDTYFGAASLQNTTVTYVGGKAYGWETIYGMGIVRGGVTNLTLAEEFENWMLSSQVQSLIPLNEWEYPANGSVPVPMAYYRACIPPSTITPLNDLTSPAISSQILNYLLLEWQNIESSAVGSARA